MDKQDFIDVTQGASGYFAVQLTWDDECEAFVPYQTGIGRFRTLAEAQAEARLWAECEGLALWAPAR